MKKKWWIVLVLGLTLMGFSLWGFLPYVFDYGPHSWRYYGLAFMFLFGSIISFIGSIMLIIGSPNFPFKSVKEKGRRHVKKGGIDFVVEDIKKKK